MLTKNRQSQFELDPNSGTERNRSRCDIEVPRVTDRQKSLSDRREHVESYIGASKFDSAQRHLKSIPATATILSEIRRRYSDGRRYGQPD